MADAKEVEFGPEISREMIESAAQVLFQSGTLAQQPLGLRLLQREFSEVVFLASNPAVKI